MGTAENLSPWQAPSGQQKCTNSLSPKVGHNFAINLWIKLAQPVTHLSLCWQSATALPKNHQKMQKIKAYLAVARQSWLTASMLAKLHYTNVKLWLMFSALTAPLIAYAADPPPPGLLNLPPPPGLSIPGSGSAPATPGAPAVQRAEPAAEKSPEAPALPPPLPGLKLPEPPKEEEKKIANPAELLPKELLDKADPPPAVPAANEEADLAGDTLPPPPMPFQDTAAQAALYGPTLPATEPFGPPTPEEFGSALSEAAKDGLPEDRGGSKTWHSTLAPSRTYPKTNFIYKRVVLPASIYRTAYAPQNAHLPIRRTRTDYDAMLMRAAARNDVAGVRALLNAGVNVNQRDGHGDSALIVAIRAGAKDTARLLLARGANPAFYGRNGKTPFGYARASGDQALAKMLVKRGG